MADIEVTTLDSPSSFEEVLDSNIVFFDPNIGTAKRLPTVAVLNPIADMLTEPVDPASANVAYIVQDNATGDWYKVLGSNLPAGGGGGGGGGWITKANLKEKIAQNALTNPNSSVYYQEAGVGVVWFPRITTPIFSTTNDWSTTCRNFYYDDISGSAYGPETSFSIHEDKIFLVTGAAATVGDELSLLANQPRAKRYQSNLLTTETDYVFTFGGSTPNIELAVASFGFYFPDGSFLANTATHVVEAAFHIFGIPFRFKIDFAQHGNNNWFFINDTGAYDLGVAALPSGYLSFRIEMDSVAQEVRVYLASSSTPLTTRPFADMAIEEEYAMDMRVSMYLTGSASAQVEFGVTEFGVIATAV